MKLVLAQVLLHILKYPNPVVQLSSLKDAWYFRSTIVVYMHVQHYAKNSCR